MEKRKVKISTKSLYHNGQTGVTDKDYGNTLQIKADNENHKGAYRSRVGKNNKGLNPKDYREGKYFMVYPHNIIYKGKI